jgi:hypothetical protein
MTTAAQGQSATEARTMALAMFADQVPCFFELHDPPCEKLAVWVAYFAHEENVAPDCEGLSPWPVCEEHRQALRRVTSPFWRMWLRLPSMPCDQCGTPARVDRFEPVG